MVSLGLQKCHFSNEKTNISESHSQKCYPRARKTMCAARAPIVVVAFPKEKVSFLHIRRRHKRIKSLKCFTGYTLGTGRPFKGAFWNHQKTLLAWVRVTFSHSYHVMFVLRKIAQMLHWLYFRDSRGLPSRDPLFDPAGRGVQNTLEKCVKGPFCAPSRAAP